MATNPRDDQLTARDDQLAALYFGVENFNRYREQHPEVEIDFFGENFEAIKANRRGNLAGVNFSNANLSGANLDGMDLSGANLRGAKLNSAKLNGTNLKGADLRGADLNDTDLSTIQFDKKTNIDGATFFGTTNVPKAWVEIRKDNFERAFDAHARTSNALASQPRAEVSTENHQIASERITPLTETQVEEWVTALLRNTVAPNQEKLFLKVSKKPSGFTDEDGIHHPPGFLLDFAVSYNDQTISVDTSTKSAKRLLAKLAPGMDQDFPEAIRVNPDKVYISEGDFLRRAISAQPVTGRGA